MKSFFNIKQIRHVICVLATMGLIANASADSQYHVVLDTSKLVGSGWLDLQFNPGQDGATAAIADLTHFSGQLSSGQSPVLSGSVFGDLTGNTVFSNQGAYNDLFQAVNFGQVLSFNLRFSGAFLTTPGSFGTSFGLSLYGADQVSLLGNPDPVSGSLLTFELMPAATSGQFGKVTPTVFDNAMLSVSAVPEPSEWLLMLVGLTMLGAIVRVQRWRIGR
ncbi:NF038129 family PEP-CTERM protein [Undibacterium sp. Ren11W]|uniref:NF038129 family PEP-CTERM protein n=1 Tax=Undibacterium sp. Ren11W TaxID=3413045 RepID=UPI003BF07365